MESGKWTVNAQSDLGTGAGVLDVPTVGTVADGFPVPTGVVCLDWRPVRYECSTRRRAVEDAGPYAALVSPAACFAGRRDAGPYAALVSPAACFAGRRDAGPYAALLLPIASSLLSLNTVHFPLSTIHYPLIYPQTVENCCIRANSFQLFYNSEVDIWKLRAIIRLALRKTECQTSVDPVVLSAAKHRQRMSKPSPRRERVSPGAQND